MGHADAIGRIYIQRLSQSRAGTASSGVADMANTHITDQPHHVAAAEHIPRQAFALALVQFTIGLGYDTSGILSAMLQHRQGIVKP